MANSTSSAEGETSAEADGSGGTASRSPGPEGKPTGTDQWARAVVDGVHDEDDVVDAELVDDEIVDAELVEDGPPPEPEVEPEIEIVDMGLAGDGDGDGDGDGGAAAAAAPPPPGPASAPGPNGDISVEDLVADLERVTVERDQYLDASRRIQAEFENFKKQSLKREGEARERANDSLIGEMLPVLDAFDGAVANGAEDVVPMRTTFMEALGKLGLERLDPMEQPFDPTLHEAVMHEDASDTDGPVVTEVMRAGYTWKGRVLRPAMVRTRG